MTYQPLTALRKSQASRHRVSPSSLARFLLVSEKLSVCVATSDLPSVRLSTDSFCAMSTLNMFRRHNVSSTVDTTADRSKLPDVLAGTWSTARPHQLSASTAAPGSRPSDVLLGHMNSYSVTCSVRLLHSKWHAVNMKPKMQNRTSRWLIRLKRHRPIKFSCVWKDVTLFIGRLTCTESCFLGALWHNLQLLLC